MKRQVGLVAAVAAVTLVPAAQAQAPAKSVTASGIGTVAVKPDDKTSNASIKAAVEAAEAGAQPKAIAAAREDATRLAAASGLTLGGIVSVSDVQSAPFYYGPYFPYTGTFGPGKYCGTVRTSLRLLMRTLTVPDAAGTSACSREARWCRSLTPWRSP